MVEPPLLISKWLQRSASNCYIDIPVIRILNNQHTGKRVNFISKQYTLLNFALRSVICDVIFDFTAAKLPERII